MTVIKKLTPMLNHILTTCDVYEDDVLKDGILSTDKSEGTIKEYQRIVALGPNTYEQLNVGDTILINPKAYMHPVHSLRSGSIMEKSEDEVTMEIKFPVIEVDGTQYLYLYDGDVDAVVEVEETED